MNDIRTIAFPSISTGIYGYPIELAAQLAIEVVGSELRGKTQLREVIFCCFSQEDLQVYERLSAAPRPRIR